MSEDRRQVAATLGCICTEDRERTCTMENPDGHRVTCPLHPGRLTEADLLPKGQRVSPEAA